MTRALCLFLLLSLGLFWACEAQQEGGTEEPVVGDTLEQTAAPDETSPAAATPEAKIELAESAGPPEIAANAAILDIPSEAGAQPVELRAGTNGWTCIPDDPVAPGKDPMCLDGEWMKFMQAWMSKSEPTLAAVGIGYMLQGGSVPSNTDPFATEPPPGEDWLEDGPHLMVITPDNAQLAALPTDPASGGPYVMWAGTPYAHIMIPVTGETD